MCLDNFLVYSFKMDEHMVLFDKVFDCLAKCLFYCKLMKCALLRLSTNFLGFGITVERFSISAKKFAAIKA